MARTIAQLAATSEEEANPGDSHVLLRYTTRSHQCMHFYLNCEYIHIETRSGTKPDGPLATHGIMQQALACRGQPESIRYFLVGNRRRWVRRHREGHDRRIESQPKWRPDVEIQTSHSQDTNNPKLSKRIEIEQ